MQRTNTTKIGTRQHFPREKETGKQQHRKQCPALTRSSHVSHCRRGCIIIITHHGAAAFVGRSDFQRSQLSAHRPRILLARNPPQDNTPTHNNQHVPLSIACKVLWLHTPHVRYQFGCSRLFYVLHCCLNFH